MMYIILCIICVILIGIFSYLLVYQGFTDKYILPVLGQNYDIKKMTVAEPSSDEPSSDEPSSDEPSSDEPSSDEPLLKFLRTRKVNNYPSLKYKSPKNNLV